MIFCCSIIKLGTFARETNYFRIVNNTKVNVKREKTSYYVADPTGFEPAIFSVTGDVLNQATLRVHFNLVFMIPFLLRNMSFASISSLAKFLIINL